MFGLHWTTLPQSETFFLFQMSRQQKPIKIEEKEIINKAYADGVSPTTISNLIGKSVASIKTFYCRWMLLNSTLPPKISTNRSKISDRMGLLIKKQIAETPKLGLKCPA